jgi:hypothetical protein
MTIQSLGYIKFRTHTVAVSQDDETDLIYCFKHTVTRCELESFSDQEAAAEYILTPLPTVGYHLTIPGESNGL